MRAGTRLIGIAVAATLASGASAQQVAPEAATPYQRAIAAGYKALAVCNGVFAAGRTPEQIEREELRGTYPEYEAILLSLRAVVDRDDQTVAVEFAPDLPPRSAAWDRQDGCELAPIGSKGTAYMNDSLDGSKPFGPAPADPRPWPLGDANVRPRPAPALSYVVGRTFDESYGTGSVTTGVLIIRNGAVVAERYAPGWGPFTPGRTWSVAKSIAGTLIGIARLDPAAPANVPEWSDPRDPRRQITLDQLLRMASGLHSDTAGNRTDAIYFGGTAVIDQAPGWSLENRPGSRFRYANNDILLAVRSLHATLGADYAGFPRLRLFEPLGMFHTQAGRDWRGDYILSSQVWSTARDLARLGELWRNDGMWAGKRILPKGWVRYMVTPSGPQPAEGPGYGATLWLFGTKHGLPAGSYAAQGNRGQYIMVVPSERLVVVRRGEDPGTRFDIARFTADVIGALR